MDPVIFVALVKKVSPFLLTYRARLVKRLCRSFVFVDGLSGYSSRSIVTRSSESVSLYREDAAYELNRILDVIELVGRLIVYVGTSLRDGTPVGKPEDGRDCAEVCPGLYE
jgi:hypothetical protein